MPNITKVYLLNVPLENDYKNTLYFTSKEAQQAYFASRVVKTYTDFSYQRKDHIIRIPEEYDEIYHVNYVMYQNTAYSNKWFYAFITELKYVNDGMTEATIETDVIQTWLFDYQLKPSFVEREHVSDDTLGLHTIPENVETGDYIVNSYQRDTQNQTVGICVSSTVDPSDITDWYGAKYNGIPSGERYYYYNINSISTLKQALQDLMNNGKIEAVSSLFLAPTWLTPHTVHVITESDTPNEYEINVYRISNLNGYVPRNNKLLTYPYCTILVNSGQNQTVELKQEVWTADSNGIMKLKVFGALAPGCSIRAIPMDYNGINKASLYGVNLGKFPQINWATDPYTNWLTENGLNMAIQGIEGATEAVKGGISKDVGSIASGLTGIATALHANYLAQRIPPQTIGNGNAGDVVTSMNDNCFHITRMSIKQEYAQIIDKYFDMFGYQVNMVKVPNVAHRSRWWFTKTIDINIDGAIPQDDMQRIKNAYNNGITFWRNANEIEDYSLSNDIV